MWAHKPGVCMCVCVREMESMGLQKGNSLSWGEGLCVCVHAHGVRACACVCVCVHARGVRVCACDRVNGAAERQFIVVG